MKKRILFLILIGLAIPAFFIAGCGEKAGFFGQPITQTATTAIKDILARPAVYASQAVKVEGKIIAECPAGGWFMLKDEKGTVYVDLHPSDFAIPQVVGKKVVVQGNVRKEGAQIWIVGKGVQIL